MPSWAWPSIDHLLPNIKILLPHKLRKDNLYAQPAQFVHMDYPVPRQFLQMCNDIHGFPMHSVQAYCPIIRCVGYSCSEETSAPIMINTAMNIIPTRSQNSINARDPPPKKPCIEKCITKFFPSPLGYTLLSWSNARSKYSTNNLIAFCIFPRRKSAGCTIPGIDRWICAIQTMFLPNATPEDPIQLSPH